MRKRYAKLLKRRVFPRSKGVLKIEKIGRTEKDLKFINRWSRIRSKGRIRYIITRGIGLGLLLFLVWLVVTVIEISMSEFQRTLYFEHFSNFIEKCIIWFCCYMALGFILANGIWKRRENGLLIIKLCEHFGGASNIA